jgi:hypothetical protein
MQPLRRSLLACLLAAAACAGVRAQPLEFITLRHRTAEDLLPLLQPFVEPGGALSGQGNQLFLRASPANARQILDMLAALDRAPRQLIITVQQDRDDESRERHLGAGGGVVIDSRRGVQGGVTIEGGNARTQGTRNLGQRVRVTEGARATISIGTAIPFTFRQYIMTPQRLTQLSGTSFYEAVSGFAVRPVLAGDVVTLELAPVDAAFTGQGVERTQLMTRVQGRLGEWIALGDADLREESQRSGTLSSDSRMAASRRGVWVKVEEIGR